MKSLLPFDIIQKSNKDFLDKGFTEKSSELRIDHKFGDVKVEALTHNDFNGAFAKFVYDNEQGKLELKLNGNGQIWTKDKFHLQKHLGLPKDHKLGTTFEFTYNEDRNNLKTSLNQNKSGTVDANIGFEINQSAVKKCGNDNNTETEDKYDYRIKLDSTFNLPKIEWGAFGLNADYDLTKGALTSLDQAFYTKYNNADIALVHKVDLKDESYEIGTFEGTIFHQLNDDVKFGLKTSQKHHSDANDKLKFTAATEKQINKKTKMKLKLNSAGVFNGQLDYNLDKNWKLSLGSEMNLGDIFDQDKQRLNLGLTFG